MCYSPIKIRTNKVQYRNGIDPVFLTVPCGKCGECQRSNENDWFVRIYYEWLQVQKTKGKCFFITLTYNDAELPKVDTSSPEFYSLDIFLRNYIEGEHFISSDIRSNFLERVDRYESRYNRSCLDRPIFNINRFDKSHVRDFFKSLRQLFDYDGLLLYEDDRQIRYYCSTEYGDINKTFRPHVHALVFIPFPIDDNLFLSYCRRAWSHRVSRKSLPKYALDYVSLIRQSKHQKDFVHIKSTPDTKWNDWYYVYSASNNRLNVFHSRGFVNFSDKGSTIKDIAGCKYLTSYLNYYDNIMRNNFFDMIRDYAKLFPSLSDLSTSPKTAECITKLREVFPFHLSSQRFGFELYLEYGLEGKLTDKEIAFLKQNEVTIPSETHTYKIPQYLLNRLMYDDDAVPFAERKVRLLSDIGSKVLKQSFDDKIKYKTRKYAETVQVLTKFLTKDDFDLFGAKYPAFRDDPKKWLNTALMYGFYDSPVKDALYDIAFRNVVFAESGDNLAIRKMSMSEILDNVYDLYDRQIDSKLHFDLYYEETDFISNNPNGYLASRCFNSLPQFADAEFRLKCIEFVRSCVLSRDNEEHLKDMKKKTRVRQALDNFKFNT